MTAPCLHIREASEFLRGLGAPRVLVAIHPDNGRIKAATPRDKVTLASFLQSASDGGLNLYFTPNRTKRPLDRKPLKADMKWFDFAHVELDPADNVTDLASWQKRTRAKLAASDWPPTVMWSSGNGIQALWRIREPILLCEGADDFYNKFGVSTIEECESRNNGLLEAFADDQIEVQGTWNIDRILRIPGTINFPNAKKRAAGRTIIGAGNVERL
jgi:hypothetical protein